jgi:hypothetical protein
MGSRIQRVLVRAFIGALWAAYASGVVATEAPKDPLCCAAKIFGREAIEVTVQSHFGDFPVEVRTIKSEDCRLFVAAGEPGGAGAVAWLEIMADGELDAYAKPSDTEATAGFTDARIAPSDGYTDKPCCGADLYTDDEFRALVAMRLGVTSVVGQLKISRDECRLSGVLMPPGPATAPPDSHLFVDVGPDGELRFSGAP